MVDSTKTLTIIGQNRTIFFKANECLLEILNANKISINQSCGANGSCTTCRVIIHSKSDFLSARTEIETERALERNFASNERLACQTLVLESVTIEIPEEG
ncbi:MAG: 2Fe-2S iron-sulfur cluster-binding protein [Pseudobdellovibrio sp.]